MKTLVLTETDVAFCDGVQQTFDAVRYRSTVECIVYADDADDFRLLHFLAGRDSWTVIQSIANNTIREFLVPSVVDSPCCLQAHGVVPKSPNTSNVWAVSGLNGFCVAYSDLELCQILKAGRLTYPVAMWQRTREEAIAAARNSYCHRFFRHFDHSLERLMLPPTLTESFVDWHFEKREQRRKYMTPEAAKLRDELARRCW